MKALLHASFAAMLFAWLLGAQAADAPSGAASAGAGATASSSELIRPGLYRIGDGGTLLRVGTQGLVVVASGRLAADGPLMAAIERIGGGLSVRGLVLIGAWPDQADDIARFADAGVAVIVQRQVLARLAGDPRLRGTAATRPAIGYDTDYLLRVGEVVVEIEHVGRGRTGADSIVLFRDLRVVAVGELFTAGTPAPDCGAGGSFAGWVAAIDHLLWSDFDVVVASRGAPVGRRDLADFKGKLEALAARAASSPSSRSGCGPPK